MCSGTSVRSLVSVMTEFVDDVELFLKKFVAGKQYVAVEIVIYIYPFEK